MPCLVGLIAIFAPRVAIVLIVIFSDWLGDQYDTVLWPFLGFLFMPFTTLACAWAHDAGNGTVSGGWIVLIVIAVLVDLGSLGGGGSSVRSKRKVYIRSD